MEMEIKALLVDDEEQCVKTLQDGIDWKVLGVAETFGVRDICATAKGYEAMTVRKIQRNGGMLV